MKAIRVSEFGGPETLKIQDVPDPKPDSGQVLVRVKAAGINPVDAYIRSGTYPRKPNLPYTPGTVAGGIIEAVGENVSVPSGARVIDAAGADVYPGFINAQTTMGLEDPGAEARTRS